MSDDEVDEELLELLRKSLGIGPGSSSAPPTTKVLESAEYVCNNSIDVAIDMAGTKAAAHSIWSCMRERQYSTEEWNKHELHPKSKDEQTVNFIFTMDLLNFSFWSDLPEHQRFAVNYRGRRWTGYWSLVAALQRALDESEQYIPAAQQRLIQECTLSTLSHIFRSHSPELIPLLAQRLSVLREAGEVLEYDFGGSVINLIKQADYSASRLVNSLVEHFPCFRDEATFYGKRVRFHKRAQIFVADLWACFNGEGIGRFDDIETLTIFADYRIPQMLNSLGCLMYSPSLEGRIRRLTPFQSGEKCEIELRGNSIWCVELIKREILRQYPEAKNKVNAILIDFFLYDMCKDREREIEQAEMNLDNEMIPHHRTRSIWY